MSDHQSMVIVGSGPTVNHYDRFRSIILLVGHWSIHEDTTGQSDTNKTSHGWLWTGQGRSSQKPPGLLNITIERSSRSYMAHALPFCCAVAQSTVINHPPWRPFTVQSWSGGRWVSLLTWHHQQQCYGCCWGRAYWNWQGQETRT